MKKVFNVISALLLFAFAFFEFYANAIGTSIYTIFAMVQLAGAVLFGIGVLIRNGAVKCIGGVIVTLEAALHLVWFLLSNRMYLSLYLQWHGMLISLMLFYIAEMVFGAAMIGLAFKSCGKKNARAWCIIVAAVAAVEIIVSIICQAFYTIDCVQIVLLMAGVLFAGIAVIKSEPVEEAFEEGVFYTQTDTYDAGQNPMSDATMQKLLDLKMLLDNGIINQEEFNAKRDEYLKRN